jgi:peptidoglycan/LPS O-acetylase OafA/YrhL
MAGVVIAFLGLCISCAVVLAGASFLYRVVAKQLRQARASAAARDGGVPRQAVLSVCISEVRLWVRNRRAARPHRSFKGTATTAHLLE